MTLLRSLPILLLPLLASCSSSGGGGRGVPSVFSRLTPQNYTWYPERAPTGPVIVFVSIPRQEAVVYRNGVRIGRAAVSTGRHGHPDPMCQIPD